MRGKHLEGDFLNIAVVVIVAGALITAIFGITIASGAASRAPEFKGIANWINSPPLTMEELQGQVVLVDFWTYTCPNCIRAMPHLKDWHAKYASKGLVIVGVHSPEFEFEKLTENYEDYIALKFTGTSVNAVIDPEKTASFGVQVTIDGRPLDPSVAGADLATADGRSFFTVTGASCTRWSLCPSSANMS